MTLKYNELQDLVLPKLSIDEFSPKTGDNKDVMVLGFYVKDKEPAKVIYARNGDIHFEAPNGQITLKARNIRLVSQDGDGEVTIQAESREMV